jgi:hypothetical protein
MAVGEILDSFAMSANEIFVWSLGLCICLVRINVVKFSKDTLLTSP